MKVLITGTKEYPEPKYVRAIVQALQIGTSVYTRGSSSVDHIAIQEASAKGLPVLVMRSMRSRAERYRQRDTILLGMVDQVVLFCENKDHLDPLVELATQMGRKVSVIGPTGRAMLPATNAISATPSPTSSPPCHMSADCLS